jgi:hypothetical protein
MELRIEFSGDVVERQELLNGTQTITIEGASADGKWTLVGSLSWNRGLVDFSGEGDLTLVCDGGDEMYGTPVRVLVEDADDDDDVDHHMQIQYEIDGGTGVYAAASGTARAEALLAGEQLRGTWVLTLES